MNKVIVILLIFMFFLIVSAEGNPRTPEAIFDSYSASCDVGEPFSCLRLGDYYYTGRVVEKDISMAESIYEKAALLMKSKCDEGNMDNCAFYAGMLQIGKGVEQNVESAYEIYNRICNSGGCEGCGRLYKLNSEGLIPSDSPLIMCSEPVYRY